MSKHCAQETEGGLAYSSCSTALLVLVSPVSLIHLSRVAPRGPMIPKLSVFSLFLFCFAARVLFFINFFRMETT